MNPEVKFQQAHGNLPFPRGVEEIGRKSLALSSLAFAKTCHSGNLCERKLLVLCSPGKLFSRKRQEKLHSSSVCKMESKHWEWEWLSFSGRVWIHTPAQSQERWHPGFFWCPSKLWLSSVVPFTWGNGIGLALACSITPNAEKTTQGKTMRGRDRHYIPFSRSFSIKRRTFINNKKLHVQEALLWGRNKYLTQAFMDGWVPWERFSAQPAHP